MAAQVPSKLYRSRSQKMIAGVSGGLGEYFDVDPVLIRLLFVVTAFISGAGILAYIVLWIVVPFEGGDGPRFDALKRDFDDLSGRVRDFVDPPSRRPAPTPPPTEPAEGAPMNPETAATAAPDSPSTPPIEDLYGAPYGPPPPYAGPSYAQDPYPSTPPFAPPADRRKRRQHWAGAILIVLGLLFLGNNLGLLWWIEARYLLPLILVAAGAWLVFGRGRRG
jgi:phage shock protein C